MAHRIRYTMTQEPLSSKLDGIVEIDETYIGGKIRLPRRKRVEGEKRPSVVSNKAAVVSVLQRDGRVQSRHIPRVTAANLKPIVEQMVSEDAHVMTDSANVLVGALKNHRHDQVNHFAKEYARYEDGVCITTNSVEGFFGILKRGINGVYHHVGQQHLHRYLTEFDYRYNSRKETDSMRTIHALKSTTGKRLMLSGTHASPTELEGSAISERAVTQKSRMQAGLIAKTRFLAGGSGALAKRPDLSVSKGRSL